MGRFKHEGAESIGSKDGRVVFYLGDDERFDYVCKFVTESRFDPENRAANMDLLDKGTLYVAKFSEDGQLAWLPLIHGDDFAATKGIFKVLLKCSDPAVAEVGATFSSATTANGWFGMPDNCAVDSQGRLWVSTDGNSPKATGRTDGLWAVGTDGGARATSKLFFRVPVGAEMCGPLMLEDLETAFVAVQHPADGGEDWQGFGRPSYYEDLSTRWPDFKDAMPVRPSVVVITRQGGGKTAMA